MRRKAIECSKCGVDLRKWNLDPTRKIICDKCLSGQNTLAVMSKGKLTQEIDIWSRIFMTGLLPEKSSVLKQFGVWND